jgi:thiamine biosynthesis lipoprotein
MGTEARAELHMTAERDLEPALAELRAAVAVVGAMTDRDEPSSLLSQLNRGAADGYHEIRDHDFYRCVLLALDYADASNGAFDPTVGQLTRLYASTPDGFPRGGSLEVALRHVGWDKVVVAPEARALHFRDPEMLLDLGGVDRGFALDMAARVFARPGARAGLLRLGGNLYAWGRPPGEETWRVAVPDPREMERTLLEVRLTNRGVSVTGKSGTGVAAAHRPAPILDPATGLPAVSDLIAAVAIADSAADADALSTAFYVLGLHKVGEFLERTQRVEAILVVAGEAGPYLLVSKSLEDRLELSAGLAAEIDGRVRYVLPPQSIDLPF